MRTDGLYAFDEDTRALLRLLDRRHHQKVWKPAPAPEKKPALRRGPIDPSPATRAAIEWEDHKASGGTKPAEFFADKHSVKVSLVYGSAYRVRARRMDNRDDPFARNSPYP